MLALDACEWRTENVIDEADAITSEAMNKYPDIQDAKIFVKAVSMGQMMCARKISRQWRARIKARDEAKATLGLAPKAKVSGVLMCWCVDECIGRTVVLLTRGTKRETANRINHGVCSLSTISHRMHRVTPHPSSISAPLHLILLTPPPYPLEF
jgi:hypothetical protein